MRQERREAVGQGLWRALLGALLAGSALPMPEARAAVPVGSQFQVNTYTTSHQRNPSVAVATDGAFVVVWTSDGSSGTDTTGRSVQAQRYASDGTLLGSQFQVNSYTTNLQDNPAVAFESDGDFVVVWGSYGSFGTDASGSSVQAQRYASDGTPLGSQFQVNTYTTNPQGGASVALAANGDFVVVWASLGSPGTDTSNRSLQGQRYASDGTPLGGEFQVNSYTTGTQYRPVLAVEEDGDFLVVWQGAGSSGTDSSSFAIQGQRYASDGTVLGGEFQVNSYTTGPQSRPSPALDSDGNFVVAWTSDGSSGTDTSSTSIQGQRHASDGTALGGEFQVNSYTTDNQYHPSVATEGDGDFVVVWVSTGSAGTDTSSRSIQGQHFASNGTPLGAQFQVNSYTTNFQDGLSLARESDGDFVVVWRSYGSPGTDSSGWSIQGQRYGADETDADGDGFANGVDNCIDVANPSQLDVDGDGCGNLCDADFDQNGLAGGSDFNTFRLCFSQGVPGSGPAEDPTCAESDMDGNGVVGGEDFARFRLQLGSPPGPGSPSCL